ncbi:MAG: ATP-binding protein [Spirochaetaceae bacterium]|nr:ATP-binding protein [Spirochaetaceae bacterium]
MKISARNLGVLKQAEFEVGDLTLICGDNNTGKTYATYALFGFLSNWRRLLSVDIPKSTIDVLVKDGVARIDVRTLVKQASEILSTGCADYVDELAAVFASRAERFKPTEFRISLNGGALDKAADRAFHGKWRGASEDTLFSFSKESDDFDLVISLLTRDNSVLPRRTIHEVISRASCELLFRRLFARPFIASAERTGGTMFRDQLEYNPRQMSLFSRHKPDYPLPVQENVDFIRRLEQTVKADSFIARDHKHILAGFSDIIGGDYRVKDADSIYFKPARRRLRLTMDESSSAVRSLLIIGLYLRHVARPGDLLMIDEPELNLHPRNQRRVARLLAQLVNVGIRVFATTHSDYIVKELNTLIMLKQDKPNLKRIAKDNGYRPEELLTPDQIQVYLAEPTETPSGDMSSHSLVRAPIDSELGIEARSFDNTINEMNEIQDAIIWGDDG